MDAALLAPAALALGLLLGGPVLAHMSRRRPVRRVDFGAMMLLERVQKRMRRRRRIQDPLVLLLRALAVLLVVLAVSRPELRQPGNAETAADEGPVVIVMDDSLSMALRAGRTGDETLFSRARSEAAALVRSLPPGVRAGVVRVSGRAVGVTGELSADHGAVAAAIEQLRQGQGTTDLAGGLRAARRLLEGKGGRVVVFSDEAGPVAVPAAEEELKLLGRQGCALERRRVVAAVVGNVAPVSAQYGDGVEGGSVRVRLMNHGADDVEVPLVVRLPDGAEITAFAEVPAGAEQEKTITVPRVAAGGVATARIDDPLLDADDGFAFHLPRVGASRVLVVDGDPGPTPTASEVYFLERALAPWGAAGAARGGVLPEVTSPAGLAGLDPDVHRVVFMANVSDPGPVATELADFVRRGGGLVIAVGDNVTADRYNGPLGSLLPAPLREPRAFAAPGEPGEATALPDTALTLFQPFARGGRGGFASVRWRRLFLLAPYEDDERVRTLLRTEGGVPVLVERRVGEGRVVLLTGTVDLSWGDLPLQSVFMPLTQRLIAELGGEAGGGGERRSATVGDSVWLELPDGVFDVSLTGPAGSVAVRQRDGGIRFTPDAPGAYVLETPGAPALAWIAVNTDPVESDVTPGPGLVETAAKVDPERFQRRIPLSPWLLLGGLVLAALAAGLAHLRGRSIPDPASPAEEHGHAA
ncbi:MAG: VWA domain-containing protein [Myxococcota bacterium]|nr:VWA domain-containing protein [Myxococcota bacterium]